MVAACLGGGALLLPIAVAENYSVSAAEMAKKAQEKYGTNPKVINRLALA